MSEELLINVTPEETRVAYVENGVLQEVHIERCKKRGLVGNIYRGRICRVLPGMQAAFVDINLERTAFLHASDLLLNRERAEFNGEGVPSIRQLLHDGEEIIVQVAKDPLGSKGARLTTQLSIPSRFLVYLPGSRQIGVSQRIEDESERDRLRRLIRTVVDESGTLKGGFIVRTAADGVTESALRQDIKFLQRLWSSIEENIAATTGPTLLHEDMPLVMRTMRDLATEEIEKIRIDSQITYDKVIKFASRLIPELGDRIVPYTGERPLFDLHGVEDEIQRALGRKVELKSGGYLIVDQTEAMTTIDVNTGAFVGHRNLEETIFKTNLEATAALARQLRLRNLGGIIIIDFIDMNELEHRRQVLRTLERALERDHAKTHISDVSPLGLVQMTRKRTRESLEQVLCEECPVCGGRGKVKTAESVCYEIFREIMREAKAYDTPSLLVLAAPEVIDVLEDDLSTALAELEEFVEREIRLQAELLYSREQFDIVLM
ncbi:ribonuclease G [Ectothiorhodospiraceae bacterium BW-2]|nr:ribonuclease G [Ectothiorhodospiraceae bacterium BW-2]